MAIAVIIKPGDPEFHECPKFERNAHGIVMEGEKEIGSTLQCPHCGGHFVSIAGSGKRRTYCWKCKAVTCGQHACDECNGSWEKQMDLMERAAQRRREF